MFVFSYIDMASIQHLIGYPFRCDALIASNVHMATVYFKNECLKLAQ